MRKVSLSLTLFSILCISISFISGFMPFFIYIFLMLVNFFSIHLVLNTLDKKEIKRQVIKKILERTYKK